MKVELRNVTKAFPSRNKKSGEEVIAVNDCSFTIPDGKLIGLLGPSGCGKSTTLYMICGLQKPTKGQIFFGEDDVTGLAPENRGVGLVFQNYALYPHLTVKQNILFPLQNLKGADKLSKEEMLKRAYETAKLVQIDELMDRKPSELSGGQQQRVAIARALVKMPRVLLLDEPLSNLDAKLRNQMRAELIKLRQRIDTTFIYVTHDQTEAMTLGDRIVIMKDGFIQQVGTPQQVFDHPANLFVAGFIGTPQMNFFDGTLVKHDGRYFIETDGLSVELSEDKQQRLAAKDVAEQQVTVGVRPEHVIIGQSGIPAKVDVSEMMGSSVHLHMSALGGDMIAIVPLNGEAAHYPMGMDVKLSFGGHVAHVFSKDDSKNLEW